MFKMNLPYDKTFGDVEKINFKYKFEDGDSEKYASNAIVIVNTIWLDPNGEYYSDFMKDFDLYPAVYYSLGYEGEFDAGYGSWATFSMKTAWFDAEGGASDNARFSVGDNYQPDLESLKYENVIWIGVGFNTKEYYYMDDIELIFKCEGPDCDSSVEKISASPVNVFSIPGGLAIQGAEKAAVYGIDGSLIAIAKGNIALPKGVYIVKIDNQVVKAIVK